MTPARCVLSLATAAVLVAGCQAGSPQGGSSPTPTSPPPSSPQPTAGTPSSPPPSDTVTVEGLSFTRPAKFRHVKKTTSQRNEKASYELMGPKKSKIAAPIVDVFVERGDIGSAKVRAASIRDLINIQLKNVHIITDKQIGVAGARRGWLIETKFSCTNSHGKAIAPCHQIDVLIQTKTKPQYGLRYFASQREFKPKIKKRLLSSLRVNQ